jgi:hypothetical protein
MTKVNLSGSRKDPRSAVALVLALLVMVSLESLYLEGFRQRNEKMRSTNSELEARNQQLQRHIVELRSLLPKINATFIRLNDSVVRVTGTEGHLPIPGHMVKNVSEYAESKVVKSLHEYGLAVKSLQEGRREASISFEVASNRLELHRLIPFLAQEENSNAFLFVDKMDLVRPSQVPSFSMNPTRLETRLLLRNLSEPK